MQRNHEGFSAVHMAALHGKLQVFKYFITERNCNPACPGPLSLTPPVNKVILMWLGIWLLNNRWNHNVKMSMEIPGTALHRACAGGCQAITQVISDLKNKWHSTPLHAAVSSGHLDIVKIFISDRKCDLNNSGDCGGTPPHHAAEFGHLQIVKYFTDEQDCDPSCLDDLSQTPLHWAARNGRVDVVKFLTVEKHCDSMCEDSDRNTPLHTAAGYGHTDVVKFLTLEMHCDPMCRDSDQDTHHFTMQHRMVI